MLTNELTPLDLRRSYIQFITNKALYIVFGEFPALSSKDDTFCSERSAIIVFRDKKRPDLF